MSNLSSDLSKKYDDWLYERSSAEYELYQRLLEYEEQYFEDMRLADNSLSLNGIFFDLANYNDCDSLALDNNYFRVFIVGNDSGFLGRTNSTEHIIEISVDKAQDKSVILHEMIHAHEDLLQNMEPTMCECLVLSLYLKLSHKVPNIDQRIISHAERYNQDDIYKAGGQHSLLFFLKSLDMDIRCKYSFGTVFGYGYDKATTWLSKGNKSI